jgi:thioredoxin 1
MLELNQNDFDARIAHGTFVVDFSAEWCPPCRVLTPILERVAAEMTGAATFATVDADRNGGLLVRFAVQVLPTIVVFRDGQAIHAMRGLRSERALAAELREAIDRSSPIQTTAPQPEEGAW